jgi:16S rRNA (cytidine1402-2'-O)-methyltransferase
MGILFVVSTPIGNLEDITLRALKVLSEVEMIACEDTRKTGLLLHRHQIKKPRLLSFYEENEAERIPQIVKLIKEDNKIALVANAGTPTLSDPGFKLVRECLHEGIKVESIPGPSAILTALTSSGLPTDKFFFLGYLPKKEGKRLKLLKNCSLNPLACTLILFEAPHRLIKTLTAIQTIFGEIEIVICRELTKIHEEIRREKISQSIEYFGRVKPKGEFTLVFRQEKSP